MGSKTKLKELKKLKQRQENKVESKFGYLQNS